MTKVTENYWMFAFNALLTASIYYVGAVELQSLTRHTHSSWTTLARNHTSPAQQNQARLHIKILWFTMSARNGTQPSNVPMYELNAGALSLALREAQASGLIDQRTTDVEVVFRDGLSGNATKLIEYALAMCATPGSFQVMFGPALSSAARVLGNVATAMRRLHIGWGATAPELSDRTVYPNVIRPQPNYYLVMQCLQQFLVSQNMTKNLAVLYYDDSVSCPFIVSSLRQTVKNYNITVTSYGILSSDFSDEQIASALRQASFQSRIIFGCGMFEPANLTRTIQLYRIVAAAKKLGMTDGAFQWILFMTDLTLPQYHPLYAPPGKMPLPAQILLDNKIDLTMAELVEAMKHFLYAYHHMIQRGDSAWRQKVLDALADPPWNENMTRVRADLVALGIDPENSPAYLSAHLADSLTLYLMGVQRAHAAGVDYKNPYVMYDILRNITFVGHSGYFALNRDGERLPDVSLHGPAPEYDSKSMAEKFEDKGNMRCSTEDNIRTDSNGISGKLELDRPFVWYTRDGLPPPGVPVCGYRGELCQFSPLFVVVSVVGGFVLSLCLAGVVLWIRSQQRRKTELLRLDWLLDASKVHEKQSKSVSMSSARFQNSGSQATLERKSSVDNNDVAVVYWNHSSRDSFGEDFNTSDAETNTAVTDQHFSILNQVFARGTYQDMQVSLYKWSWAPASSGAKSNFVTPGRSFEGGTPGSVADEPAQPKTTANLVAYVREHRECQHELLAMRRVNHDNVCAFIGAYYDAETRQLVFVHSHSSKGTLSRVLRRHQNREKHQPLQWFFKRSILLDIALGLDYLQNSTQLEFHGRLSSDYVVIDSRWVTKITGFGRWSFGIEHPEDFLQFESADEDEREAYKRRLLWTAPEVLRQPSLVDAVANFNANTSYYGGGIAKKREAVTALKRADVFSFGVIMSEVIYDLEPYSERLLSNGDKMKPSEIVREIMRDVRKNEVPIRPLSDKDTAQDGVSAEDDAASVNTCRRQMIHCWAEDPAKRPNIKNVAQSLRAEARAHGGGSLVDTVIAKLELYAQNLESLVQARTDDLQEEKRRADGLLRRLLPEPIAEQLKRGESIVPQMYESASVYFSDIVSFTTIASLLTPLAVVDLLNMIFMYMDDVLARYAVYKMETIGDGYMVVSGLPNRIDTHAAELASMALDIRSGIALVSFESLRHHPNQTIRIRLGLHSGPVVAGVVGLTMPRYCLFGDTVNVASRMESQGEPMQIQISESMRQLLGFEYIARERGAVKIKGKGLMHTYWLDDGPTRKHVPQSTVY